MKKLDLVLSFVFLLWLEGFCLNFSSTKILFDLGAHKIALLHSEHTIVNKMVTQWCWLLGSTKMEFVYSKNTSHLLIWSTQCPGKTCNRHIGPSCACQALPLLGLKWTRIVNLHYLAVPADGDNLFKGNIKTVKLLKKLHLTWHRKSLECTSYFPWSVVLAYILQLKHARPFHT